VSYAVVGGLAVVAVVAAGKKQNLDAQLCSRHVAPELMWIHIH
jgi:hypothetical protein